MKLVNRKYNLWRVFGKTILIGYKKISTNENAYKFA